MKAKAFYENKILKLTLEDDGSACDAVREIDVRPHDLSV